MRKRIIVLIVILLVVIGVSVAGFIYDRNDRLIARTTGLVFDEGCTIEKVNKHGFPFRRAAYEAKISIPHDRPEAVMNAIYELYGEEGSFMTYAEYYATSNQIFQGVALVPKVENGSNVWVLGLEFPDKENVFFFIVSEDSEHACLYIYYSRY